MRTVYFDHAATTPLDERVLDAMMPFLKNQYGNANSPHHLGQQSKVVVEDAREMVANLLGADPSEIIFTSGGTESDNAAIQGVLEVSGPKKEIISCKLEHHAVLHPVEMSKRKGFKPVYVEQKEHGVIDSSDVANAITDQTALITLMHVNNEIGVINPVGEIAEICGQKKVPFHTDGVQSVGKIPVNLHELGIDLLSASGHKIYGPKGIGILYVKNGTPWLPWMQGGSQERRRRGGTLNVPGIVGFAKALELSVSEMENNRNHYQTLREYLFERLDEKLPGIARFNGCKSNSVPHIINISLINEHGKGVDGEMLILNLDIEGICVSNGSACTSGAVEPSHVLTGLGVEAGAARSSIRVSVGKQNTKADIDYLVEKLELVLNRMFAVTA